MASAKDIQDSILGSAIVDAGCAFVLFENVKSPKFFVGKAPQMTFTAMLEMYRKELPIDEYLLSEYLLEKKKLDKVGGREYVSNLCNNYVNPVIVEGYCKSLKGKFTRRQLNQTLTDLISKSNNGEEDLSGLIQQANLELMNLEVDSVDDSLIAIADPIKEIINDINTEPEQKVQNYIDLKIQAFNDLLGGGLEPTFQVWAARPAMGKTSVAATVAYNIAVSGTPVAFFNLEVKNKKLGMRILAIDSGVPYAKIKKEMYRKSGQKKVLTETEHMKIISSQQKLGSVPLFIDDTTHYNVFELKARIIYAVKKLGAKAIFIDYLGLIDRSNFKGLTTDQSYGQVTRTLKNLSQSLDVPIIALHQLSRETEKEKFSIPQLRHLRESGNIEQDAEVVVFFHRPDYYEKKPVRENGTSLKGILKLICAKHRDDAVSTREVEFVKKLMIITDTDYYLEQKRKRENKSNNEITFDMADADISGSDDDTDDMPF